MSATAPLPQRQHLHVSGVVQGVGFRPFIFTLAERLGLNGFVGNDSSGCFIEIEGTAQAIAAFGQALRDEAPPLSHIEQISQRDLPPKGERGFHILPSQAQANAATLISPDLNICDDCLRELFDPTDRRYLYPFINCTNCGPRYTIIQDIPYDRDKTTMASFAICEACAREYADPRHRRFHAQPNACPVCGPQVYFVELQATTPTPNPSVPLPVGAIAQAQAALQASQIVAIKGIGGFHLACDARNDHAVQTLRQRKGRGDKPFAVMVRDLASAHRIAQLAPADIDTLCSRARPIVIVPQRANDLSRAVAPGNHTLGIMLPYSPLHHLLLAAGCDALVMTSGNLSDEPIVTQNEDALAKLAPLADAFLLHNRDIFVSCDDSVVRAWSLPSGTTAAQLLPIRRARGYAPFPVSLPFECAPTLAVGGELKATFCLGLGNHAFISQHLGDMENAETLSAFEHSVTHLRTLFRITPSYVVCDKHPNYLSSQWARATGLHCIEVQHHHAHIASVMAEHGLRRDAQVIGIAFDGTGYGDDGAIWGGEVLVGGYAHYRRVAHLAYAPLPGGDAAVNRPYRAALAQLWVNNLGWDEDLPCVQACPPAERRVLQQQLTRNVNCAPTSSMGRLFDAVAALIGVRQVVGYEAQGAIELESLAANNVAEAYTFEISLGDVMQIGVKSLFSAIVADVKAGLPVAIMAAKFHNAVANLITELCLHTRAQTQLNTVALSGGCFQNVRLLAAAITQLQSQSFEVLYHRLVPPNDGGLALGQLAVAQTFYSNDANARTLL